MDFNFALGKKLIWTGTFDTDEGFKATYLLFEDMSGVVLHGPETGKNPTLLVDAKDTLSILVSERFDNATAVMELAALLKHPLHAAWVAVTFPPEMERKEVQTITINEEAHGHSELAEALAVLLCPTQAIDHVDVTVEVAGEPSAQP